MRFEGDHEAVILARESGSLTVTPPGTRLPLRGDSAIVRVFRTGRPARIDLIGEGKGPTAELVRRNRSAVSAGAPITVEGEIWGVLVVSWEAHQTAPAGAEERLAEFAALLETAIANAEARSEVQRLVAEQAALRRVATLVAEGAAPSEVFDAAILEVRNLLGAAQVGLMRAEGAEEVAILAHSGQTAGGVRPGLRLPLTGASVTAQVLRTGHSARVNAYPEDAGEIAAIARRNGVATTVGAPVTVEGAPWGVITVSWLADQQPPRDAEQRLVKFAQLLDTAIANADSRDQLMASRVRVLTAGDEARRRLVRDLHDGAQQRLVHTIVDLKLAQQALDEDPGRAAELLAEALDHAQQGNEELRELAHGIIPSVLTRGGLRAALDALVSRHDLDVDLEVTGERLPPPIEASAYFIAAEALTNVVKHARASRARVGATVVDGVLRLEVRDDGVGGADPYGHGLIGLADRVDALRGELRIESPAGGGTVLEARLPTRPAAPADEAAQRPSDSRR
jgi:signal transduction histidine kinase